MIELINIIYCCIIFAMGSVFGSFFTLAVYRLPLHKDITHERSFCPNCNHRLEFLDMIPIWSYIFLGGKCRYCGQKIRPRYLILEILSGLVFLVAYLSYKINFTNIAINGITDILPNLVSFLAFIFMYITLIIVGFINKEYKTMHWGTMIFGTIMQLMYCIVLLILNINYTNQILITTISFSLITICGIIARKKENILPFYISLITIFVVIVCNYLTVVG